jgi:hypothetical protein
LTLSYLNIVHTGLILPDIFDTDNQ